MAETCIAAVDPGREKCGLAVLQSTGEILYQAVIETAHLIEDVEAAKNMHNFTTLVLGDGTTSEEARKRLETIAPHIVVVDEKYTTEEARRMYWEMHPPKGWRRILPVTMQFPPVPVDDYVAVILARRYMARQELRKGNGDVHE